jgi:glutathione peroxidase
VSFPLFSKIDVNGDNAHPLYKHLRTAQPGGVDPNKIAGNRLYEYLQKNNPDALKGDVVRWNFTKFLVDPEGNVVKRYEPDVTPEQIEADLASRLATKH